MKARLCGMGLATLVISSSAYSAAPPSLADLAVGITPPAPVAVGDPGQYRVNVANTGNKQADGVMLTITLPRTNTSPTVAVLGDLVSYDSRCARSGTNLVCPLGSLRKGASTQVRVTIELPQSSAPLVIGASATTSSAERTNTNNNDSETAVLLHPLTPVAAGDSAFVEHCTGTGLTSFFECEMFPSSISSHEIEFQSGGLLAFVAAPPGYWGEWDQDDGDDRLHLDYYDGASLEATFDGYAVGGDCFEGVTTFYPPSAYVAPYRVCLD